MHRFEGNVSFKVGVFRYRLKWIKTLCDNLYRHVIFIFVLVYWNQPHCLAYDLNNKIAPKTCLYSIVLPTIRIEKNIRICWKLWWRINQRCIIFFIICMKLGFRIWFQRICVKKFLNSASKSEVLISFFKFF